MSTLIDKSVAGSTGAVILPPGRAVAGGQDSHAHRLIIGALAVIGVVDIIWLQVSSFRLDLHFLAVLLPVGAGLALLCAFYTFIRPVPRIARTVLATAELLFFTCICGIFSYLLTGIGSPWRDETLASWDRLLGFDWIAYADFLSRHPWLFVTLGMLYQTSIMQLACLVLILGFSQRSGALIQLLGTVIFAGIVAVVIGALMPALGAYHYFNLPDHGLTGYVPHIIGAHDRTLTVLDPRHFEGLVMFPSYHTALSLSFIMAAWPLRYLRYPVLIANLLLLAGVPVFGGHYLTDMLGGGVTFVAVAWIWRRVCARSQPSGRVAL